MSRFDEILDDVIDKAKYAADVAGRKTNEVVEISKLKYRMKTVEWDIEKAYSKLGALVYEAKKSGESYEDVITLAVDELDKLNAKLDDLEDSVARTRQESARPYRPEAAQTKPESEPQEEKAPEEEVFDYTDED